MKTFLLIKDAVDISKVNLKSKPICTYKWINKFIALFCSLLFLSTTSFADYTVGAGVDIDASNAAITGGSGVLTINGTLHVTVNTSLANYTSVIINGPSGQIYWDANKDLSFSAGTTFVIVGFAAGTSGLQPAGTNGAKTLTIGSVVVAVSNENSNNAVFSFDEFNGIGGLPQFTISSNGPVCLGNAISVTATPNMTSSFQFKYTWAISPSPGGGVDFSPAGNTTTSSTGADTRTITPTTAQTYTVTCTVKDGDGNLLATKSGNVTVDALETITRTSNLPTISQTPCINTAITNITYSIGGSGTGASATGLPTGVTGSYSGGVYTISGTPTVAGTYNYTVTTTGGNCPVTATGSITVRTQTITLTSAAATTSQSVCINSAITPITYTLGGSATNAGTTGLPAGLITDYSAGVYSISGTPTVSGTFNYLITTSGTCTAATTSGTITVNAPQTLTGASQSVPLCSGNPATINLTGLVANSTNNTINYTINGVAQTPVTGVNANASGNASFNTANLTAANNGQILQITSIAKGSCTTNFTRNVTLAVTTVGTWLGNNTNWYDPSNWCGGVPTAATDAILPTGLSNYPSVSSGTASVHNINIAGTANVVFTNNAKLQIGGTITNTGTFNMQDGVIELNGSGVAQAISGAALVNRSVKGLIISNASGVNVSAVANDYLSITNYLSFGNVNNTTLNTNDNIVLKSTASATARVADVTNNSVNAGNNINGKVTIERYLPMSNSSISRRWRLLTAPIKSTGAPTIKASWQEGASNASVNAPVDPRPGYGTQITNGNTAAAVANGFDMGSTASPSIYYLNAGPSPTWVSPSATNSGSITDREGYMIFVRGDRSILISTQYVAAKPATLSVKGNLNIGNVTKTLVTGKQVIGNPYASAISFDNVLLNGATPNDAGYSFYYWDPKTSGSYNVGRFITVTNDGVGSPSSYTVTANVSGLNDGKIESGAAVVIASAGGPNTLVFHETDKINTSNTVGIASRPVGTAGVEELSKLYTNLYAIDNNVPTNLADGVVSTFYPLYSNDVNVEDAQKLISFNSKETVSILRDSSLLSVEKRITVTEPDTTYLQIKNMDNKTYVFEFVAQNFSPSVQAFLQDKLLGTLTPLNLGKLGNTLYTFQVDNSVGTDNVLNRFKIIYKPIELGPLPIKFKNIQASKLNKAILVEWTMENASDIKQYEVEKSVNGISFSKIATYDAAIFNQTNGCKSIDNEPFEETNFYRVRAISKDGEVLYSSIVKVLTTGNISAITVTPSLITNNGDVVVKAANIPAGKYKIRVVNSLGQVMYKNEINHTGNNLNHMIKFDGSYSKGTYMIQVSDPANQITQIKVIKQ